MTEGHKHRLWKVKDNGLIARVLTGPVLATTTDRKAVEESGLVWYAHTPEGPYMLRPLGLLHGLTGVTLDTQDDGILTRAWKRLSETWGTALVDSTNGELTYREWGDYGHWHVIHGWWVDPKDWSFGISFTNDLQPKGSSSEGRVALGIEVGPFDWSINLCQPLRSYRREVMKDSPSAYFTLDEPQTAPTTEVQP